MCTPNACQMHGTVHAHQVPQQLLVSLTAASCASSHAVTVRDSTPDVLGTAWGSMQYKHILQSLDHTRGLQQLEPHHEVIILRERCTQQKNTVGILLAASTALTWCITEDVLCGTCTAYNSQNTALQARKRALVHMCWLTTSLPHTAASILQAYCTLLQVYCWSVRRLVHSLQHVQWLAPSMHACAWLQGDTPRGDTPR